MVLAVGLPSPAEKSVMEQLYEAVRDINIGNRTYKIQCVGELFVITKARPAGV
jgi:hypothetical protein